MTDLSTSKSVRRGLVLSLAVATTAPASNYIWQPALGGSWNDKTNWSTTTQLPGPADTVFFTSTTGPVTTAHTITVPTPATVLSLTFLNRPGGTLDVPTGSSLTVTGTDTPATGSKLLRIDSGTLHVGGQVVASSMLFKSGQVVGTVDFPSTTLGQLTIGYNQAVLGGGFRFNGSGEVTGLNPSPGASDTVGAVLSAGVTLTGRAVTSGVPAQLKFPKGGASYGTVTLEAAAGVDNSVVSLVGAGVGGLTPEFTNYGTLALNAGGSGTNARNVDATVLNKAGGVITVAGGVTASFNRTVNNVGTINLNGPTAFAQALGNAGVMNVAATPTFAGVFENDATLNLTGPVTIASAVSGTGTLIQTGAGTATLSGSNTYTGVTRVAHVQATLVATPAAYNNVLANAGGLDVASGAFVLEYDTAAPATSAASPAEAVRGFLAAGKATNFATGHIRSSGATATRGLGYVDDGHAVTVRATFYGDADLDGGVSINDFNALATNFGKASGQVWVNGDFDYDGGVSINDFNLLAANFGQSLTGPAAAADYSGLLAFAAVHHDLAEFERVTGVPEPAAGAVLGIAGAGIAMRRRNTYR